MIDEPGARGALARDQAASPEDEAERGDFTTLGMFASLASK